MFNTATAHHLGRTTWAKISSKLIGGGPRGFRGPRGLCLGWSILCRNLPTLGVRTSAQGPTVGSNFFEIRISKTGCFGVSACISLRINQLFYITWPAASSGSKAALRSRSSRCIETPRHVLADRVSCSEASNAVYQRPIWVSENPKALITFLHAIYSRYYMRTYKVQCRSLTCYFWITTGQPGKTVQNCNCRCPVLSTRSAEWTWLDKYFVFVFLFYIGVGALVNITNDVTVWSEIPGWIVLSVQAMKFTRELLSLPMKFHESTLNVACVRLCVFFCTTFCWRPA